MCSRLSSTTNWVIPTKEIYVRLNSILCIRKMVKQEIDQYRHHCETHRAWRHVTMGYARSGTWVLNIRLPWILSFVSPYDFVAMEILPSSILKYWLDCRHIYGDFHELGEAIRLHTAVSRADFVSWWMWFNGTPTKLQRHFLTNAFCYLRTYVTFTKIRNRPDYL